MSDGRPVWRAGAGLYDSGAAAPGFRWAYGGGFGEALHGGALAADAIVFPDRAAKAPIGHRSLPVDELFTP